MQYRRFGRTGYDISVLSCGGMRFQHSWKGSDEVPPDEQVRLSDAVHRALDMGINHIETARGYGTSEEQLGKVLPDIARDSYYLQTKVGPSADPEKFAAAFEKSMTLLKADYVDLFAFHGVNNGEVLEHAKNCYDRVEAWRNEGRIRAVGFSTHGTCADIVEAIETDLFDYVNLHWYYIFQENWPAIEAARAHDMGVFIISPNDKGGLLYKPSERLCELTAPLHPMVFNGLFCLMHEEVHTLSCGVSRATDFETHSEMIALLDQAEKVVPPIVERLEAALNNAVGAEWAQHWGDGIPEWHDCPNDINIRWILRLRNLAMAYDMIDYGRMRYNLLGNGGHWFPGSKADDVPADAIRTAFPESPFADELPAALEDAHSILSGAEQKRLSESGT